MVKEVLARNMFGNSLFSYLVSLGIVVAGASGIVFFTTTLLKRLGQLIEKGTALRDGFLLGVLRRFLVPLAYIAVLYAAVRRLALSPGFAKTVDGVALAASVFYSIQLFLSVATYALELYWSLRDSNATKTKALRSILTVAKVLVWGVALVFLLDNLGFKITAIVAGLGIGGVAVALATQTILGDLFSYFAIFFDRPFETDDFVTIGDFAGTIEHIGIKTTRVRSLGGEQIIFANSDLTTSRLRNYKRMDRRRVVFTLGVTYSTDLTRIREIPGIVKSIVTGIARTQFERAHFATFGESSLIFEVVYYVMNSDYNLYMDIQQEINCAVKQEFEKRGIEFAYPTQTVHIAQGAS